MEEEKYIQIYGTARSCLGAEFVNSLAINLSESNISELDLIRHICILYYRHITNGISMTEGCVNLDLFSGKLMEEGYNSGFIKNLAFPVGFKKAEPNQEDLRWFRSAIALPYYAELKKLMDDGGEGEYKWVWNSKHGNGLILNIELTPQL